jgi:hypothetical protein
MRGSRLLSCWVLSAACLTVAALPGQGHAQTLQSCLTGQIRYAGTACRGLSKCYVKAMKKGLAVDSDCINEVLAEVQSKYANIESQGDCLVEPAGSMVANMLDSGTSGQASAITNGGKCSAGKMGAIGRECKQLLMCYARATEDSSPVDPFCLSKAEAKMSDVFDRMESKYGCNTTGDASARADDNDTMTDGIYTYVRGTGTTTTTTSMSTSTTTLPGGCPEDGSFTACTSYRDNAACTSCVDLAGGVAHDQCTGAGPTCGDAFQNQGCAYAINTATTCAATCCP